MRSIAIVALCVTISGISTPSLARDRQNTARQGAQGRWTAGVWKQRVGQRVGRRVDRGRSRSERRGAVRARNDQRASKVERVKKTAPATPKKKRWSKREPRTRFGAFLKGLFVDGPKSTGRAIKKKPLYFLAGLGVAVAAATVADLAGLAVPIGWAGFKLTLSAHNALVAVSAGLAAFETLPHIKGVRKAKGKRRAQKLGRLLWSPLLVAASAAAGGALGSAGHGQAAHSSAGSTAAAVGRLAFRTGGHLVTTADAPSVLVTAKEDRKVIKTWRNVLGRLAAPFRKK